MRRVAAVLVVVGLALPAGLARADDAPAPAPARSRPGALVVALGLQSPLLQAGVVRGRDVILARGFEVELARTLARRLGGRVSRFVYVPSQARLLASSGGDWQLALGGIDPSRGARAGADLSVPYLTTDVAVVARRGLERPRRLADLRASLLCAVRGGDGARAMPVVRPRQQPVLVTGTERLRTMLRTGACDAALVPGKAPHRDQSSKPSRRAERWRWRAARRRRSRRTSSGSAASASGLSISALRTW